MSFSYDGEQLELPLNHLRFMTQDTDATNFIVSDEEIAYVLGSTVNIYRAAAKLCRAIAAKLLREPNLDLGTLKIEAQAARAREMNNLAKEYENEALRTEATLVEGASGGAIILTEENPYPPAFTRNLHFS